MTKKHDALLGRHCETCAMFHNPTDGPVGYCVAHPPTAFIVGAVPKPGQSVLAPNKAPEMVTLVDSKSPVVAHDYGCWEHKPRGELLN